MVAGFGLLIVVLVGRLWWSCVILGHWSTNEYAITPATRRRSRRSSRSRAWQTNPHHDKIMLTDVYLSTLTAWQWIADHFKSHVQFVTADELVEPGVSRRASLNAQGFLEMSDAKQAAEVAAFRALGWRVPSTSGRHGRYGCRGRVTSRRAAPPARGRRDRRRRRHGDSIELSVDGVRSRHGTRERAATLKRRSRRRSRATGVLTLRLGVLACPSVTASASRVTSRRRTVPA